MRTTKITLAAFAVLAALSTVACGSNSACQSGSKYGTQCYSPDNPATQPAIPGGSTTPASSPPSVMPASPAR